MRSVAGIKGTRHGTTSWKTRRSDAFVPGDRLWSLVHSSLILEAGVGSGKNRPCYRQTPSSPRSISRRACWNRRAASSGPRRAPRPRDPARHKRRARSEERALLPPRPPQPWPTIAGSVTSLVGAQLAPSQPKPLIESRGIAVPIVSKMLGHANRNVTLTMYAHATLEMQDEAARIMDEIVTPVPIDLSALQQVAAGGKRD